jgi:hypothetical protein
MKIARNFKPAGNYDEIPVVRNRIYSESCPAHNRRGLVQRPGPHDQRVVSSPALRPDLQHPAFVPQRGNVMKAVLGFALDAVVSESEITKN